MNRLLALFALLLPLLFAAAPAYGVMLRAEKSAVPDFFWPSQLASGDEPPCSQDCTMDAAIYGYDFAEDVRVGPNLYAYVKQNPWTAWDPHGLSGWMDPRGLPGCSPQLRTALDDQDRQKAASLARDCQAVGQWVQEHPRIMGGVKAVGGAAETTLGVAGILTPEPTMVTKVVGGAAVAHGADTFVAGVEQMISGSPTATRTQRGITAIAEKAGASPETARVIGAVGDAGIGLATTLGTSSITSSASVASRVSAAEAARLSEAGYKGTVSALVVPNGLVPKVFTGASTRAGGPGAAGLAPEVEAVVSQYPSRFNYGCAEGDAFSKAIRAGVNPAGGASSARAVSSGKPMEACDNCSELLKHYKVKDAHGH